MTVGGTCCAHGALEVIFELDGGTPTGECEHERHIREKVQVDGEREPHVEGGAREQREWQCDSVDTLHGCVGRSDRARGIAHA